MSFVRRTMYWVEKFTPANCPNCGHIFQKEGTDWGRIIYQMVKGEKRIVETVGYYLCLCLSCKKEFHMVPTESYQVGSKDRAEQLCRDEGFVNLIEVTATGNMAKDHHVVHQPDGLRVERVECK